MSINNQSKITWSVEVPIFKQRIILRQLGIAIGIPFGLLILFMFIVSNPENRIYFYYAMVLIVTLFVLTYVIIMLVYRGKYSVEYQLDETGIHYQTLADIAKKNRIVNELTIGLGVLARNPTVAGAGMLANARQSTFLQWEQIRKVHYDPRQRTIYLQAGPLENMALFCNIENYEAVTKMVKEQIKK